MKHREGIDNVMLYWKIGIDDPYQELTMTAADNDMWEAYIPAQAAGTKVYYYIRGEANDGKVQTRPMVAPEGYHFFRVLDESVGVYEQQVAVFEAIYPNPATAITVVPLNFVQEQTGAITIIDQLGREVMNVYTGRFLLGARSSSSTPRCWRQAPGVVLSVNKSRWCKNWWWSSRLQRLMKCRHLLAAFFCAERSLWWLFRFRGSALTFALPPNAKPIASFQTRHSSIKKAPLGAFSNERMSLITTATCAVRTKTS